MMNNKCSNNLSSSESDFDDDDDPDSVEVPGGGIDLKAVASSGNRKNNDNILNNFNGNLILPANGFVRQPQILSVKTDAQAQFFQQYLKTTINYLQPNLLQLTHQNDNAMLIPNINMTTGHEEEGMGVAETYAVYKPRKLKIGVTHPDSVVESTSLASVEPVDVKYNVSIPDHVVMSGSLSALQLESITYACQAHESFLPNNRRAGFLIGDGAGVGKGRQIAGIIYENYLKRRKRSIWVSVISDLKEDAERDLRDIGASKIKIHALNKMKYCKINSAENGKIKKGIIFCTYSSLIAKTSLGNCAFKTRFNQLLDWCGTDFDGVIIFDECHRAKNVCPSGSTKATKTGLSVLDLQEKLPKARVVYASATGATEPRNMAYMTRLGMWGLGTPFVNFEEFLSVVTSRGVLAMELLAMDMKLRGMYIARQLSFQGVSFKVVEVPLTKEFIEIYDKSTKFWDKAHSYFKEATILVNAEKTMTKTLWSLFWASHQRFFKYLCISAKVKHVVSLATEAVKCGKSVVIGLQSTGEARTLEQLQRDDGELSDFVSSAKGVIQTLIEKHFPAPDRNKINNLIKSSGFSSDILRRHSSFNDEPEKPVAKKFKYSSDSDDDNSLDGFSLNIKTCDSYDYNVNSRFLGTKSAYEETFSTTSANSLEKAWKLKLELLKDIEKLGQKLPPNTLDDLIDQLGGPDSVAEMTGRKGRVVHNDDGFGYESRSLNDVSLENLNAAEKQRFMDGVKEIAIISEVASSGISLHSDRRAKNKRPRVHITLELPWSADRAIQQFGRTHRSNQANAPEYIFLISNLAGERRFASVVAKRLESLGALTHGDRRATETRDLSQFNIDNNYGREAMEITEKSILGYCQPLTPLPKLPDGDFVELAKESLVKVGLFSRNENNPSIITYGSDNRTLGRFLNRIMGIPVELQNTLFDFFSDTMDAIIEKAKVKGNFDLGILDLAGDGRNIKRANVNKFERNSATGKVSTDVHEIIVERGMTWEEAVSMTLNSSHDGFYLAKQPRNDKREVILAVSAHKDLDSSTSKSTNEKRFTIYRPNIGAQAARDNLHKIRRKFVPVTWDEARELWIDHYNASESTCSHVYWTGVCPSGNSCEAGLRQRTYHVLSGCVLSIWGIIERVLGNGKRLQVVRLQTDRAKIVGSLVPAACIPALKAALRQESERIVEEKF